MTKQKLKEIIKLIKSIKTRDELGGFRHIEVYKDEIIESVTSLIGEE